MAGSPAKEEHVNVDLENKLKKIALAMVTLVFAESALAIVATLTPTGIPPASEGALCTAAAVLVFATAACTARASSLIKEAKNDGKLEAAKTKKNRRRI